MNFAGYQCHNKRNESLTSIGMFINEIKEKLRSFAKCLVHHVKGRLPFFIRKEIASLISRWFITI